MNDFLGWTIFLGSVSKLFTGLKAKQSFIKADLRAILEDGRAYIFTSLKIVLH
jgi:hypothetical protein